MACDIKHRMVSDYGAATSRFAAAVAELQQKMGVSSKAQYERLLSAVDEARIKSEEARLVLEQHRVEHDC